MTKTCFPNYNQYRKNIYSPFKLKVKRRRDIKKLEEKKYANKFTKVLLLTLLSSLSLKMKKKTTECIIYL